MIEMKTRQYILSSISFDDFFKLLNQEQIKYIILRWFDKFPKIRKGEAIDLLVHDDDLFKISKHVSPHCKNNSIACNIYSINGMTGTDYNELPYYPSHCAQEMLNERILWDNKYFVPSTKHYLLSIAYHAVYYKAENSGLPRGIREEDSELVHNNKYTKALRTMINQCGINVELTWVGLQKFLDENNWTPELLVLKKLSKKSNWVKNLYYLKLHDRQNTGEIMAFIIREWAHENNLTDWIIKWLENHGLHILNIYELDESRKKKATCNLRGGDWGYNKWRKHGGSGKPAVLIIAYDFYPIPLDKMYKKYYPYVSNGNFLLKIKLRNELNKNQPPNKRRSIIHSSDNTLDALEFINTLYPKEIPKILNKINLAKEKMKITADT
ncbi:hypothetical protein I6U48_06810 [Clostridium sp. PL3]|uniref:Uncharacterized protein n=1 Tax=Clostridium thailandense TaxID=2794346 RepID=A0A949X1Z3_9CLOT|nr:hypothetical protein [Clostridium thailandense]MBV7272629.1 hypothetical protein [Clostridium thailandense]